MITLIILSTLVPLVSFQAKRLLEPVAHPFNLLKEIKKLKAINLFNMIKMFKVVTF